MNTKKRSLALSSNLFPRTFGGHFEFGTRFLPVLALALFILPVGSCAPEEKSSEQTKTIVGNVQVIGNEPFTSLALEAPDGTMYALLCPADVQKLLMEHQGKPVRIHFRDFEDVPSGRAIRVISAELVSP